MGPRVSGGKKKKEEIIENPKKEEILTQKRNRRSYTHNKFSTLTGWNVGGKQGYVLAEKE